MNEQEIIRRFFTRQPDDPAVKLGIGDDAAIVSLPAEHELVITTDSMVEGSHFTKETQPFDLGYKLMAVNLSDIAAMGAEPKWATLNVTLTEFDQDWLQQFAHGLLQCAQQYKVELIGGDLVRGREVNVSVQLMGIVPEGCALTRAGAQPGDKIFVTGTIGAAAKALQELQAHGHAQDCLSADLRDALYRPTPRIKLGIELRSLASSVIDISDGLLHELNLICAAANVGAKLQLDRIPLAELVDPNDGLTQGEDYELLLTAPEIRTESVRQAGQKFDCPISEIGEIIAGNTIELWQQDRRVPMPERSGFDHFEERENGG